LSSDIAQRIGDLGACRQPNDGANELHTTAQHSAHGTIYEVVLDRIDIQHCLIRQTSRNQTAPDISDCRYCRSSGSLRQQASSKSQ